ncbi:MAG: hypothetical protein A2V77_02120 [Anaeromyxobacter sp. RBG_16_69_14]|nr:MAG: hypothetical protein A2V77_02120 [Anaeromyxobacter sp. RBG_16_69_14]
MFRVFHASAVLAVGFALALATTASGSPPGEEVERVVAVIRSPTATESNVVTLSKVEEEARIALVSRGAVLAATQPLDGAALKAGLEYLVDQTLLGEEAARLHVFEIDRADAVAELARFRAHFARLSEYDEFLARWDLSEGELEAVLRRTLRVKRYVESRASQAAEVPEGEVTAWLARHRAELGADDRPAVRARLIEERTVDEVKALARDLRSRAEVRLLGDVEGLAPSAARSGAN